MLFELRISASVDNCFFPQIWKENDYPECSSDRQIAQYFNVSYENYVSEIIKYNGFLDDEWNECYFKSEVEAKYFINEYLTPLLIMKALIGNEEE